MSWQIFLGLGKFGICFWQLWKTRIYVSKHTVKVSSPSKTPARLLEDISELFILILTIQDSRKTTCSEAEGENVKFMFCFRSVLPNNRTIFSKGFSQHSKYHSWQTWDGSVHLQERALGFCSDCESKNCLLCNRWVCRNHLQWNAGGICGSGVKKIQHKHHLAWKEDIGQRKVFDMKVESLVNCLE